MGMASDRVLRWFEIQAEKATNGEKNSSAEESGSLVKQQIV